jgi:rubredoxin-NAD+ reductase
MEPITIIGSGLAGITLARELRKLNREVPLQIVAADDADFYSKPSLSNALAGGKSAAQLVVTPRDKLAAELGVQILPHTRVDAIDAPGRSIHTGRGMLPYGRLVLATGAHPIRLPIEGDGATEVLSVNSLADYVDFRTALEGKRRVAILGAGLIGCEFANDLRLGGYEVTVFDLAPAPLGRLLAPVAAAFLRQRLEAAGVGFHFETSIGRVECQGTGFKLIDNRGASHEADLVLSAVGLKPATELAATAGLQLNRGIVVDRLLQSSQPGIYALGDGAEVGGLNLPFIMPIMRQAKALAATLNGTPTELVYPALPVVVKTPACPTVVCPPPMGSAGDWREEAHETGVVSRYEDAAGKLLGFALVGDTNAKQLLGTQVPPWL